MTVRLITSAATGRGISRSRRRQEAEGAPPGG